MRPLLLLASLCPLLGATPPKPEIVKVEGAEVCAGLPIQGGWVLTPLRCLPWDVAFPKVKVDGEPVASIAREAGIAVALATTNKLDPKSGWALDSLYTGSMAPWFDKEIRCEGYTPKRVTIRATVTGEIQGMVRLEGPKLPAEFVGACFLDTEGGAQPLGTASGGAKGITVSRAGPLNAWIATITDPDGHHEAPRATAPDETDPVRGYIVAPDRVSYAALRVAGTTPESTRISDSQFVEVWTPLGTDERGNRRFSVVTTVDSGGGPKARPAQEFTLGPDGLRLFDEGAAMVVLPPDPRAGKSWTMGPYACTLETETAFCADGLASVCWEAGDLMRSHFCPGQGWRGQDEATWKDGVRVSRTTTVQVRRNGRAAWSDEGWARVSSPAPP